MNANASTTESLRQAAAQLLSEGKVDVVIGYGRDNGAAFSAPVFVRTADQVDRLLFDPLCYGNLAVYLHRSEVREMGKAALVVKGCDLRAVNVLLQENVIERENGRLTLRVTRAEAPALTAHLLDSLPVADLAVEDPPIEAVIDQIYQEGDV